MRRGPILERYGWGAARVCLSPVPYRGEAPVPLLQGIAAARAELRARERGALRRRVQRGAGFALVALLVASLFSTLSRDRDDESDLRIVALQIEPPEPEPARVPEPEPPPVPEPVAPEPPRPVHVAVVMTPPEPPPVRRTPEPRPAPPPKRRPEPAPEPAPRVQIDSIARAREAPPSEIRKARPAERARPAIPAPPPVSIDAPGAPPELAAAPRRSERAPRPVAAFRPAREPRAVGIDPVAPTTPAPSTPLPPTRQRPDRPRARTTRRPRPPRADLPAAAGPEPSGRSRAPTRSVRPAPARVPRSAPSPNVSPSLPSLVASTPAPGPAATRTSAARDPIEPQRARAEPERAIHGVPLGSLAACVSDRQEDLLKQKVIAAVTTQQECASRAGRYRFIETKNLNAFLMWIERAPRRSEVDRCAELRLALDCLEHQGRAGGD